MRAVMISIHPKWCELIANGKKTVEVRKTRPKLETPFKVYIYEVKWIGNTYWVNRHKGKLGKVIGEFVCDCMYGISNFLPYDDEPHHSVLPCVLEETCLEDYEIDEYLGAKDGYGWHISNLVIYDKPKELSEFKTFCKDAYCSDDTWFCKDGYGSCAVKDKEKEFPYNDECIYFDCPSCGGYSCEYEDFAYCLCDGLKPLTRPPQSLCYVEEQK